MNTNASKMKTRSSVSKSKIGNRKKSSPIAKKRVVITPVAGKFKRTEVRDISPDSTISNDSGMHADKKTAKVEMLPDKAEAHTKQTSDVAPTDKLSNTSSASMCSIEQQLAEMASPVKDFVENLPEGISKLKQTYFKLFYGFENCEI